MKPIEAGIYTLEGLKKLELVRKSSEGYFHTAKQVTALEIATLQDASIHGWQALRDLPSALLNGNLSEHAAHLWYTLAHLTFAAAVPFALVYPSSAKNTAEALSLRPIAPSTGILNVAKDLSKRLLIQSKEWTAQHPSAFGTAAVIAGLAGLGQIASRFQLLPNFITPIGDPKDNSVKTTLNAIAVILICAIGASKLFQPRKPLDAETSKPPILSYKTPLAFPEAPPTIHDPQMPHIPGKVHFEQFDHLDPIDFGPCTTDTKYTKPYTTSLRRTDKNEVVWEIKDDHDQLCYLNDDLGIVVGEDPDPDDNSYHDHEACQLPATSDYVPNGHVLEQVSYNGHKLLWSRIDGTYQPIGMYQKSRDDVTLIEPGKVQEILNSDLIIRIELSAHEAFSGAEFNRCGHQVEYIEFNGRKCPLFIKDQNIAVKIGDSLIPALQFQNVLSFNYEGRNFTSWIQLQTLRLEKFTSATYSLYEYDAVKKAFTIYTINNNPIIRDPNSDMAVLPQSGEFVRITKSNNVMSLATNELLGCLSKSPVSVEAVWNKTPSLAAASDQGFAYEQSIFYEDEKVILRAWPSQQAPQVYLAMIDGAIQILPSDGGKTKFNGVTLNVTTARIGLEQRFNDGNSTHYNFNDIVPKANRNIFIVIKDVEYELRALDDGQFIAKAVNRPYLLATGMNSQNNTIVLDGSFKSYLDKKKYDELFT